MKTLTLNLAYWNKMKVQAFQNDKSRKFQGVGHNRNKFVFLFVGSYVIYLFIFSELLTLRIVYAWLKVSKAQPGTKN